jgi:bifunctional DNA-binding transcriptional regulator/antitoxin component of YhaV-PrlF toxin-antitoxin module
VGTVQTRSIIDLGQGSFVITLPKPWVKFHHLKPGDKVEVITNGKLVVKPLKRGG